MVKHPSPRSPALALLLILLAAALACNLPRAAAPVAQDPAGPDAPLIPTQDAGIPTAEPPAGAATAVPAPTLASAGSNPAFAGLTLALPGQVPALLNAPNSSGEAFTYLTQPGDTLPALAGRFGVDATQIQAPPGVPGEGLLPPGTPLGMPDGLYSSETLPGLALLPDSEVIYGPPAAGFDIQAAVDAAGGYLSTYSETVEGETMTGTQAVRRIALETSTNPRLLLAVLEFRAGWLRGQPRNPLADFPIGFEAPSHRGLYKELALVTRQLTQGYYGWRAGSFDQVTFRGRFAARPDPRLNAGSVALQNLFAVLYAPDDWMPALYGEQGFLALYRELFGDPWARAAAFEPLLPGGLGAAQPDWQFPFAPGEKWSFTGGPHIAWGVGTPLGALDFAPGDEAKGCYTSARWATASAPGVVARSERGLLVLDLDGDGWEQTGWDLLYLHLADAERRPVGAQVGQDEPLGHPSCEGGPATGKHIHLVRKYNGEWLDLGAAAPFILSGWQVVPGELPYQGRMVRGGDVIEAKPDGSFPAQIIR